VQSIFESSRTDVCVPNPLYRRPAEPTREAGSGERACLPGSHAGLIHGAFMTWQAYGERIAPGGPPTLPYAVLRGHRAVDAADARAPVGKLYGPSRPMTHVTQYIFQNSSFGVTLHWN